ncbi:hypothetical protein A9Q84_05725 [Halobacteriovorax marinus]|uniref:TonB-dependent receptor n=1 Tax=Halobacteriovorax marinus TaxID=97084 RepID=A0A1Y5FB30_9BACT|nr:hypothetical protein A9Q84_05725 [Halobacteriovorax marinus]
MKKKLALLCLSFSPAILANQPILVTAERVIMSKDQTTSSVVVIDHEEISQSQSTNLTELIEKKSGLFINSNGAYGKSTSLFLRGADSSYTLIIIDGVEYNDRSSVGGAAILDHIDLVNVEKVEILKGSQSVLYGSDAMAGVIKITTKSPNTSPSARGSLAYGSYKNKRASFTSTNSGKKLKYSMGLSFHDVEGISSYNESRTIMADKDGMNNLTASFKAEKKVFKTDKLELSIRGVKAESDFDAATSDKTDYVGRDSQVTALVSYEKKVNDTWIPKLKTTYSKSDRLSNSFALSRLVSKTKKIELENPLYINEKLTILNGLEYENTLATIETITNKKRFESSAAFVNTHFRLSKISFQAGVRWTKEKDYEDQFVYKVGGSLKIFKKTTLKANIATGFKSPSLYQLYSTFGNEKLKPTESKSYDLSISQIIFSSIVEITVFRDEYNNVIDFDSASSKYVNTFKARSTGVEANWEGEFSQLDWKLSGTLLRAINKSPNQSGNYLARRPREKLSATTGWRFNDQFKTSIDMQYVGERENSDFDTIVLSSYTLFDIRARYDFTSGDSLSLKLGNLLDKSYEQVNGFGTPGRNYLLTWKFEI